MAQVKNILFIMADQLRHDYLGCTGHPHIKTPNIDALAADGMLFDHAYVQATVCGPSRMSIYTGRYMSSHGSTWNLVPLRVGEPTLGDHLRKIGVRTALVGKTHMTADVEGMARLGIDPGSAEGVYAQECGFEPFERDDGLHPDIRVDPNLAYNNYLRTLGYDTPNPWHTAANAGRSEAGDVLSGWYLRNASEAADIAEEHSETAYMTDRAFDFIDEAGTSPWCLHLSYIKPHWPYIAPAPFNTMYGEADVVPPVRSQGERNDPHPVYAAYQAHPESETFSRDGVREKVIPVYMGLISQIDLHIGRLVAHLKARGIYDQTMIVLTSDHGDYLGDHWLGEKELFHDQSVRVPLIIRDPSSAADATRGTVCSQLVEAIDLAPTFIAAFRAKVPDHVMEGRSLLPFLHGDDSSDCRDYVVSELDYTFRPARLTLASDIGLSRAYMIRDLRWKYVYFEGFEEQLFDLQANPEELVDLGTSPTTETVRRAMRERLFRWSRNRRMRITVPREVVCKREKAMLAKASGMPIGEW